MDDELKQIAELRARLTPSFGRQAYDAYREALCGPCRATTCEGQPVPKFEQLPAHVKRAWECAAQAVRVWEP